MAERLNGTVVETDSLRFKKIERDNIIQMGMFQYMIGNTDFSLKTMHNLKAVQPVDQDAILIAYDFDYSGLVDARYAVPNPSCRFVMLKIAGLILKAAAGRKLKNRWTTFCRSKQKS